MMKESEEESGKTCEARWHGKEYCPRPAKFRVEGDVSQYRLCYTCLGRLLQRTGWSVEDRIDNIEKIERGEER